MISRVLSVYVVFIIVYAMCMDDPCAKGNYSEFQSLNIGARQEGCLSSVFEECDYYFNDTLWYTSSVGKLLTHCPRDRSCGSPLPAWIDGVYPDEHEGLVNRTVCIKKGSQCCSTTLTMEIKNCSTFAVFRLPNVPSCPSTYCFESNLPCETTTTTTTTAQTTKTIPTHRMDSSYINPSATMPGEQQPQSSKQPQTTTPKLQEPQSSKQPQTTTPKLQGDHKDLLIGMSIGGGVVFVCITSGIILYAKCFRKTPKIDTEPYPVVITSGDLPLKKGIRR